MKFIDDFFFKRWLPRLMETSCGKIYGGDGIPRSGDKGRKANCFSITARKPADGHGRDAGAKPYLILENIVGDEVEALEWSGNRFDIKRFVSLDHLREQEIVIRHYWGLSDVTYVGVTDFAINRITGFPYAYIIVKVLLEDIRLFFFKRTKLVSLDRYDVLKLLVDNQVEDHEHGLGIGATEIIQKVNSELWPLHPDGAKEIKRLRLILDSFVESGEIVQIGRRYEVQGRALVTLENKSKENRQFWTKTALSVATILLSVGLLLVGILSLIQTTAPTQ